MAHMPAAWSASAEASSSGLRIEDLHFVERPARRAAAPTIAGPSSPRRRRTSRGLGWMSKAALPLVALGSALFASGAAAQDFGQPVRAVKGIGGIDSLYTSSVAYCSPPIAVLVNDLSLTLYPGNSTLEFSIDAASTQNDLNISVALSVDVYGRNLINAEIDLCSILGGIICPLPQYRFSGGGVFPLPASVIDGIPSIAYSVPDLEAVATVQLTDTSSNNVVGCVQATLSNGHSMEQKGALWASVAIALLALFSSLLHSVIAQSVGAAQWRVVDVFLAIQTPVITAFLSIPWPTNFLAFAMNLAWSVGLVNIRSLQRAITATRAKTGGYFEGIYGNRLIAQYASKENPFSSGATVTVAGDSPLSFGGLFNIRKRAAERLHLEPLTSFVNRISTELGKRQQYAPNTGPNGQLRQNVGDEELPLLTPGGTLRKGQLGVIAERANVNPTNAFLTVLVSMGLLLAILIAALLVTYLIALVVRIATKRRYASRRSFRVNLNHWSARITQPKEFLTVVLASLFRYLLVIIPVFFIFAIYQWRFGDSWVGILVAALVWAFLLVLLAAFYLPAWRKAHRGGSEALYHNDIPPAYGPSTPKRWGHLAHPYRPRFWWWSLVVVLFAFIRAAAISIGQGNGFAQGIVLIVFEFILLVLQLVLRPGRDKKSDFVLFVLTFFRLAGWVLAIVLTPRANIEWIPRAVLGFAEVVVTGLPIILLFFLTLWDLFTPFLPSKRLDVDHYRSSTYETAGGKPQMASWGGVEQQRAASPDSSVESGPSSSDDASPASGSTESRR